MRSGLLIRKYSGMCCSASIENNHDGYTLLETLIALSILMVVLMPLIGFLYQFSGSNSLQKKYTAICLLEQESACIKAFPGKTVPVKRRVVDGKEWMIKTEIRGSDLLFCRMSASDGKKIRGEVVFYINGK